MLRMHPMAMHDEVVSSTSQDQHGSPFYAALARTTTRAITLYFSRPVRLFRPSKVPGISYRSSRIKFMVIPKHFVPPMLANALLGTVLWTTYTECSSYLKYHLGVYSMFTVALSGAAAGGMQAIVAAPVENVRLTIEGGTGKGWSHAWKEVFRGTQSIHTAPGSNRIRDARQVKLWMKDVSEMAGRGWVGWGWGFGKDVCGFSAFFVVFEITRKVAGKVKLTTHRVLQRVSRNETHHNSHLPRFVHALTLVCGGVIAGLTYESVCKPWDIARKAITHHRTLATHPGSRQSPFSVLLQKLQADGITSFFREHSAGVHEHPELRSNIYRRLSSALRTLARVGPWGVGFLVWESFGSGSD